MNLGNIEASFFRYLYEQLEVPHGVSILEDINLEDFEGYTKWVVIDSLTNPLGPAPKQLYFLHIAVQKGLKNGKVDLINLCDLVDSVVNEGTEIQVYDVETEEAVGVMTVSETSLSPVMAHFSGGMFRSMTVGIVYVGN